MMATGALCFAFPDTPIDPVKQALENLLLDGEEAILAIEEKIAALQDKLTFNSHLTTAQRAEIRAEIKSLEAQLETTEIEVGNIMRKLNTATPPPKPTPKPLIQPKPIITEVIPISSQDRINHAIKEAFQRADMPARLTGNEYMEKIDLARAKNDIFPHKPTTPQLKINTPMAPTGGFNPKPIGVMARSIAWLGFIQEALSFGKAIELIPDKVTAPPRSSSEIKEEILGVKASLAWYEASIKKDPFVISQSFVDAQKKRIKQLEKELKDAQQREDEWYRHNIPDPRTGGWLPVS
jgi:DNA-binding transcriptional MerR regulator